MNIKTWLWCFHCERTYSVMLSGAPEISDRFFAELEMQLGVVQDGQVYAECPYEDCDAGAHNFQSWDSFMQSHPDMPEVPEVGKVYSLYPDE